MRKLADKALAFLFDILAWRGSRAVQRMTFGQRGMYLEMLIQQWDKGTLPDDPAACADLIGGTVEEWTAAWPVLRRKFVDRRTKPREGVETPIPTDHDAGRRIVNLRLEQTRRDRKAYVARMKSLGQKGGQSKPPPTEDLQASARLAGPAERTLSTGREGNGLDRKGVEGTGSPVRARGRSDGLMTGMTPGQHGDCLVHGPVCFRPRHATKYQPRFGDHARMVEWARGVCQRDLERVDTGGVIAEGDDFAYWAARYDEAFKHAANPKLAGNLAAAARFVARGKP